MHAPPILSRIAAALAALCATLPALAQTTAPIIIGKPFIANGTDPTKSSNAWALTSHGISQNLYIVNKEGTLAPWLATGIERVGDKTWIVRLRRDVKFSDGTAMTAAEVGAALTRNSERSGNARASTGKIATAVVDPYSVRIVSERGVPNMASVLAEWPLPIYKVVGDDFVFTGPYKVKAMKPGAEFDLMPNPYYPDAGKRLAIRIKYFPETQSMALALQTGELDMGFGIPAEALARISAQSGISTRTISGGYLYLLLMNTARPPLDDVRVRRAVNLALDRDTLVKAAKAGRTATGLYASFYPFALNQAYPLDPLGAAKLLDQADWKPGADGIRVKYGTRLTMTLYATSNWPDLMIYLPIMRQQLARIGIEALPKVVESSLPVGNSGDFDLLFRVTHTAPAGDPAFFPNDGLRTTGSRNFGKFRSAEFDAVLARMEGENDMKQRIASALELQRIVNRDVPLAPIAEVPFHVGVSRRLAGYDIWGADYYIVRDDLTAR
jgi:peptide/nickel transport system substrate-binding protein